jgi:hypothetical protein
MLAVLPRNVFESFFKSHRPKMAAMRYKRVSAAPKISGKIASNCQYGRMRGALILAAAGISGN